MFEAAKRAWDRVPPTTERLFGSQAKLTLQKDLFKAISDLCVRILYRELCEWRRVNSVDAYQLSSLELRSKYLTFLSFLRSRQIERIITAKPVLLRLLSVIVRQWIDEAKEIITRVSSDWNELQGFLSTHKGTRHKVVAITGGLSDRHKGGRSVKMIQFDDGTRCLLKPKSLYLDAHWAQLVDDLNVLDPPVRLKAARVLSKEAYGWSEYIEHSDCNQLDDVRTFFRRAGAWLALLHCMAACDIHEENIIAQGVDPVITDLEMILQPNIDYRSSVNSEMEAYEAANQIISDSVVAVGLLPSVGKSHMSNIFAFGGVNANQPKRLTFAGKQLIPLPCTLTDPLALRSPTIFQVLRV